MPLDKLHLPLTLVTALGCGLIAGVFFAFSAFVMKALARLPVPQGIAAMQSINNAVLNPLFLGVFTGTALLCLLSMVLALVHRQEPGIAYRLIGGMLYLVGTFLITAAFNVPLNDRLAAAIPGTPEAAALWADYLSQWTAWNHVRTVAALAATASLIAALYQRAPHP